MKTLLTTVLAIVLLSITATAKQITAGELLKKCSQTATADFCNGYLSGWAQTENGSIIATPDGLFMVGIPEETTTPVSRQTFLDYMKSENEYADRAADLVLLLAHVKAGRASLSLINVDPLRTKQKATKAL